MRPTRTWKTTAALAIGLCVLFALPSDDLRNPAITKAVAQANFNPKPKVQKPAIKPVKPTIKVPKVDPGRLGAGKGSSSTATQNQDNGQSGATGGQRASPDQGAAVPVPAPRPVLSFGLPAIIDAPTEEQTILVVISEEFPDTGSQVADRYSVDLLDETGLPLISARALRVAVADGASRDEVVRAMASDPDIIAVQPVYLYFLQQSAAQDRKAGPASLQYAIDTLGLENAHRISTGKQIPIAIIDTAADFGHAEFSGTDAASINVSGFDAVPGAHGTAIAGILAAGSTLTGVSPDARILSIQAFALDKNGHAHSTSFTIAKALDEAASAGARVINMSFAGPRDPVLLHALDALADRNVLMIAAAGNNGPKAKPVYPGAHPQTIAVTAVDSAGKVFDGANQGDYVEIAAPGVAILAPAPDGKYDTPTGTSMATAHISGVAALLLEHQPELTTSQLRNILTSTAIDRGNEGADPTYGAGLVDPLGALSSLR